MSILNDTWKEFERRTLSSGVPEHLRKSVQSVFYAGIANGLEFARTLDSQQLIGIENDMLDYTRKFSID